jgi:hypothetical protein
MRTPFRSGVTALAVTSGALLGSVIPAHAADPAVLYVKAKAASCSDSGSGTVEQPFCTVGAAAAVVTAGQTVEIAAGTYPERVTIPRSGTPDRPITFRMTPPGGPSLTGPTAGIVIDGLHDIRLQNVKVTLPVDVPALDIRNSSAITIERGTFVLAKTATAPAIRLAGVTASRLNSPYIGGWAGGGGLFMDAATTGIVANAVSARTGIDPSATNDSNGIVFRTGFDGDIETWEEHR